MSKIRNMLPRYLFPLEKPWENRVFWVGMLVSTIMVIDFTRLLIPALSEKRVGVALHPRNDLPPVNAEGSTISVQVFMQSDFTMRIGKVARDKFFDRSYWAESPIQVSDIFNDIRKKGYKINRLMLMSHGNSDRFMIGEKKVFAKTVLNDTSVREMFTEIGQVMNGKSSLLRLGGCRVGQDEDILSNIAIITGSYVDGHTQIQRVNSILPYGQRVLCDPNGRCNVSEKQFFDYITGLEGSVRDIFAYLFRS